MISFISSLFSSAMENIPKSAAAGRIPFLAVLGSVIRAPLKAIASFIFAPFLVLRLVATAKDNRRKLIAAFGLISACILSMMAGSFLGSLAGMYFIYNVFGAIPAIGYLVGTSLSVIFTVTFQILILNATCFLFLGLSSQEIVDYLKNVSE